MPKNPSSRGPNEPRRTRPKLAFRPREPGSDMPYRRGELIRARPAVSTTLRGIGVSISPVGKIEWPRYKTVRHELGEIVQDGTSTIWGFSTLERQRKHVSQSVAKEYLSMETLAERVRTMHNLFLTRSLPTGVAREKLVQMLEDMSRGMGKGLHKETPQRYAQEKLLRAAELAKQGNGPAFVNQLLGVFNELGIRLSKLNLQIPRIVRDVRLAVAKSKEHRQLGVERIEETEHLIRELARGTISRADREKLSRAFESRAKNYSMLEKKTPTPEGKALAELYHRTSEQLLTSERAAGITLRSMRQWIYVRYARNFIVKAHVLREMKEWPIAKRHQIITQQLKLVEDNMEYWTLSPGRAFWLAPWLKAVSDSMAHDTPLRGMQKTIALASGDASNGNFSAAQIKIQTALQATE